MIEQILKKTYKYRLYPTKTQQDTLEKQLSLCRWLYNHFLDERRNSYDKEKRRISCYDQIKKIPQLKKEKPGYPRFKGYWRYDSLIYPQSGFEIKDNKLHLSKIGSLKIKLHREIKGNIKTLTLRRTSTNKWYACFSAEINQELPQKKEIQKAVGIDMGLNNFLTTDTGKKINNPRYLRKSEEKLAQNQRWYSRKKLKSKNRSKSRLKVARIHEKTANQRLDFLHKLSRSFIKKFQLIAFEKLNIKGMIRNKYLAKSISDASWSKFLQQLIYKAEEAGIWVKEVNARNTSQVCSGCGNIVTKSLATRKHQCPQCGLTIDRDINAARNILQLALTTVGTTGINACGVGRILPTMKQEATVFKQWQFTTASRQRLRFPGRYEHRLLARPN